MSQFTKAYRDFFLESQAGQEFVKSLESLIDANHDKADDATDPMITFAHSQRAKGVKEAIAKINSLTAGVKKTKAE